MASISLRLDDRASLPTRGRGGREFVLGLAANTTP